MPPLRYPHDTSAGQKKLLKYALAIITGEDAGTVCKKGTIRVRCQLSLPRTPHQPRVHGVHLTRSQRMVPTQPSFICSLHSGLLVVLLPFLAIMHAVQDRRDHDRAAAAYAHLKARVPDDFPIQLPEGAGEPIR